MNNTFENILFLLDNEKTLELGLQSAKHYQKEFKGYFGYKLSDYNNFMSFLSEYSPENFGKPLNQITKLHLFPKNIIKLPISIGLLVNLEYLYLEYNQLTSLPKEIGKLKNLRNLYSHNNQLKNLPKEIGKLKKLEYLYLGYNQLTTLPKEIFKLKKLQRIDLKKNIFSDEEKKRIEKGFEHTSTKIFFDKTL